MSVLLIGAAGQVGTELVRRWQGEPGFVATTRSGVLDADVAVRALDVTDGAAIERLIETLDPRVVINATAYTAVDRAESDLELAYRVNADAPAAMAAACARTGARLVHFSTDYVFDGSGTRPYREYDATAPIGVYGASKRAGEEAILDAAGNALVLRTAWVYACHGQNFLRTMLRLGAERDVLRVVADQVGSPTPAWLIADATRHLVDDDAQPAGIVHVVAEGSTSWHGFAEAIFEEAHRAGLLERVPRVEPITTADYPTPARRPAYSVLDTDRLRSLGFSPAPWREALAETLAGSRE